MSKILGIYVKFTKTTHQMWSCHVTLASNSENFYFLPYSVLNFRKSYQIWGKLGQEQKVTGKKQTGGWKTPPTPVLIGLNTLLFYPPGMSLLQPNLTRWPILTINGSSEFEICHYTPVCD